jgi:uncharacterized membrane protein YeaQ/YmgE (transglycosylase-associated protein family)
MTLDQLVVWLIIGALAGSLASMVVTGSRRGYGPASNILLGLIGAVVGGYIFDKLDVDLGLGSLTISFEEVAAAFVGSLILLLLISFLQKRR